MAVADDMYDEANQLKEQGDLEGAVAKLQEILTVEPEHVLTHSALAVHLQRLGKTDESIVHALKVTELWCACSLRMYIRSTVNSVPG